MEKEQKESEYKKNEERLKELKEELKKGKEIPPSPPITFYNYGWICPVCGRGNAPYTQTCPCVSVPFKYEVTC